jgi:hypothetical protein
MHQGAGLVVIEHGADRHLQNRIHAFAATAVGSFAVPSAFRFVFGIKPEVNQGIMPFARFHDDVAAASPIPAGGTAPGNELLPPEGNAAVPAISGLHHDFCFIGKQENTLRSASVAIWNEKAVRPTPNRPVRSKSS